jgi:hypothetical protein
VSGPENTTIAGAWSDIARAVYGSEAVDAMAARGSRQLRRADLRDRARTAQEVGIAVGAVVLMLQLAVLLGLVIVHVAAAL